MTNRADARAPAMVAQAARALHAALTVNPRALQARLSLARLYREAGEKQRGLEELQVAVRLHPGSPEALERVPASAGQPRGAGDATGPMRRASPPPLAPNERAGRDHTP